MKVWLQHTKEVVFFLVGIVLGLAALTGIFWSTYKDKVFPGIYVGNIAIGGYTQEEALDKLERSNKNLSIELNYKDRSWTINGSELGYDFESDVRDAYSMGRGIGNLPTYTEIKQRRVQIIPRYDLHTEGLVATISSQVNIEPVPSSLFYENEEVALVEGKDGVRVNEEGLNKEIAEVVKNIESKTIEVPVENISLKLSDEESVQVLKRAISLIGSSLTLELDDQVYTLSDEELIGFLSTYPNSSSVIDRERVRAYTEGLAKSVNREPQNARFQVDGERVKEFLPAIDGLRLNVDETVNNIEEKIVELFGETSEVSAKIVVERTGPEISTSDVNDLGITERIGRGESYYKGSIASRVYNVELTARKLDGILVAPGEEFSFNNSVGEISAATGYQTAYVISNGRTVLGDGGGVCQDSTTIFRAAMDAGLPIIERWAHSYRVGYYEQNAQPGLDATIYSPSKDLRFLNDTGNYILIDTWYDSSTRHLVYDLYGTSDGRKSYVSRVKVWDVTPPPPALYQDDPSLPAGEIKQVDWAAWGAKASFDYSVTRGGEEIFSKSFYSNFQPWQDVYLRGAGE